MKNIFYLALFFCVVNGSSVAQQFSVKGTIVFDSSVLHPQIYLLKITDISNFFSGSRQFIVDSATIDSRGIFEFTNSEVIEDNDFYRLNVIKRDDEGDGGAIYMGGTGENFAFLLLNKNSQIKLLTEAEKFGDKLILIKSDKTNSLIYKLSKLRKYENMFIDSLLDKKRAIDPTYLSSADSVKKINQLLLNSGYITNTYDNIKNFADTVSDPYVSILAVNFLPEDNDLVPFFDKMNKRFQKTIPDSKYAIQFNAKLKGEPTSLRNGSKAPDISLMSNNGKLIQLSHFLGKYVLIDFWASWCSPCRTENIKTIKPLYERYKSKNFAVLSISQDQQKTDWLNAISKDKIDMLYNVSDLKGASSPVMENYKVIYLPYNYLIDPSGVIIAQNLRGPELENFIKNILK